MSVSSNSPNLSKDLSTEQAKERTLYSYRFGTAEFNEARFELRVSGLVVEVERRALDVLRYLLAHAGEVVTKEELFREVWAGRITVDKVLPNAMTKLRRALGEANAERISTQARLGYRLDGGVNRTAVGQPLRSSIALEIAAPVPGRESFLLKKQFSNHRGSEVWLAEHAKTREPRVYKFANDGERLRTLKREATLARVLQESLPDRTHFVEIIDWNFETAPYFLECQYGGQNLQEWAEIELAGLDQEQRITVFLQIADALADAHSVGVLHKDIKPANVVIMPMKSDIESDSAWLARLTDFGSGRLMDPERLEMLGITRLGMTVTQSITADSSSGTPLYIAPEIFEGKTPTVQSDVYALGILLYQMLSGSINRPMAPGWEQDIADELLRDDLRLATNGNPERRLRDAAELAARLRDRSGRAQRSRELIEAQAQAKKVETDFARAQARRPYVWGLFAALAAGLLAALLLGSSAIKARNEARQELARASALNRFINEDLIGAANPFVLAKGKNAELKDLLLAARERIADRYAGQPGVEAGVRANLTNLFFTIDLWPEAQTQAEQALRLFEQVGGQQHVDALKTRALLARVQTRLSQFDAAQESLTTLDRLAAGNDPQSRYLKSSAWSSYYVTRGDFAKAIPKLKSAITALQALDINSANSVFSAAEYQRMMDLHRLDLIAAQTLTGEHALAIKEGEQLVQESAARQGNNGLTAALAKKAMARSISMQGDHVKAEATLLEAQAVIVAQLGESHSQNLNLLNELFGIAFRTSDYPKALIYARRVHESIRTKYGPEHNMTHVTLVNWARIHYELAQYPEAQLRLTEACAFLSKSLGDSAPQSQDCLYVLASTELALGKLDEAERLVKLLDANVLEAFRAHGLWQHGIDALSGLLLHARGDRSGAEPLLQSASEALKPETPDEPVDRLYMTLQDVLKGYAKR